MSSVLLSSLGEQSTTKQKDWIIYKSSNVSFHWYYSISQTVLTHIWEPYLIFLQERWSLFHLTIQEGFRSQPVDVLTCAYIYCHALISFRKLKWLDCFYSICCIALGITQGNFIHSSSLPPLYFLILILKSYKLYYLIENRVYFYFHALQKKRQISELKISSWFIHFSTHLLFSISVTNSSRSKLKSLLEKPEWWRHWAASF